MVLIAYSRMCTCSKRAMARAKTRHGRPYQYRPRITLIQRLSTELGMNYEQVLDRIDREREYLLNRRYI